jgi:hypothetical protein
VKKIPEMSFFKAVNLRNSLGANSGKYGRCPSVSQPNFSPSVSLLCSVQLGIFMEEKHTVAEKAYLLLCSQTNM